MDDLYKCHTCREELADDEIYKPYCKACSTIRERRMRYQEQDAEISKWVKLVGTADAKKAAVLTMELVHLIGGIGRTAQELHNYYKRAAEDRQDKEVLRFFNTLMKFIQWSYPKSKG
jgi:hypothetical protein